MPEFLGVVHAKDFDGTVQREGAGAGDIGQNAAKHPESHRIGFRDEEEFRTKVADIRALGEVSYGSELAKIIEDESEDITVDEVERILTESQYPEDVAEGYKEMVREVYKKGSLVPIVTAGIDTGAESCLNGTYPEVIGASLKQNGSGIEVEKYCGRTEKPLLLEEWIEDIGVEGCPVITYADSPGDADMMNYAIEDTGGQAIAVDERAVPYASVDASEDQEYQTAAVLGVIFDEIYVSGNQLKAKCRARKMMEGVDDWELKDVEPGPSWDATTLEGLSVYKEVRQSQG